VNQDAQQQAEGVDSDVAFTAVDLLARIEAAGPDRFGGLERPESMIAAEGWAVRPSPGRIRSRRPSGTSWVTPASSRDAR
jgi:hypothetical protein